MDRVQFIEHKGKKILHLNFAYCKADDILPIIDKAKTVISTQTQKSVYVLTDVTEAAFNAKVSDSMKEFVSHNKPFVAASAVVGVVGLKQIIFNAVMKVSGRELHAFDSLDQAKEWLSGHS